MADNPLESYYRIAELYSDNQVTRAELLERVEAHQKSGKYNTIETAFHAYLRHEYRIPTQYAPQILELNRKLSDLDIEALSLKDNLKRQGITNIHVTIDGLVNE